MPPKKGQKRNIDSYSHVGKERANNPPVGLVTPVTDQDAGKTTYAYDPHLDPQLQWAGKTEHTTFEVPTVSLHVHERIDPRTIVEAVRKRNGNNGGGQLSLFESEREIPVRDAIEFYKHSQNWSNRLIAGDSLLVMNSLLQKESMAGKVQCVYMDPPYGIKYGGFFMPFVDKMDVKDGKDEDLTTEPEVIKAFRDTWELGIHSYLSYMRDRLLLTKELLSESGSVFVQISDENVHHVREVMDEVFGRNNFVNLLQFRTASTKPTKLLSGVVDFIVWYAKDKTKIKYREIFSERNHYSDGDLLDMESDHMTLRQARNNGVEIDEKKIFTTMPLVASTLQTKYEVEYNGKTYNPPAGWRVSKQSMDKLINCNRIFSSGNQIRYKKYYADFPLTKINATWLDLWAEQNKSYVVQTSLKVIERCILMTTDPGDLVLDPTCGSGTTAAVAEQWGRRWITCDTSRIATTLAKQRLMTATFDYYKLAYQDEGVGSGFEYKKVPHITLKSIANDEPPATETLYDQPLRDTKKARVTGPFTVEAVPAATVTPIDDIIADAVADDCADDAADYAVARSGETVRQDEWRDELLRTGIRGKNNQHISFASVEPLPHRHLHATADTKPDNAGENMVKDSAPATATQRAVISFGPEHAPLEQRQVENAIQEANTVVPKPEIVIFVAFQFDSEAGKDIDQTNWPGMTLLKVQMNTDLQTADLKKKQTGNESFWLIGRPDIEVKKIPTGDAAGKYQVTVNGFDYLNTRTGNLESGGNDKIAIWLLDTDYDARSLYPTQVFFPMSDAKSGWSKLAKNLRAEIDEDLIEAYRGTVSLPFELGERKRIAVKIVDDRGIESLRVVEVGG